MQPFQSSGGAIDVSKFPIDKQLRSNVRCSRMRYQQHMAKLNAESLLSEREKKKRKMKDDISDKKNKIAILDRLVATKRKVCY